jgi:lipopolysaccharide/colanic/teichoic acid biosynthesis glycosyltransferase
VTHHVPAIPPLPRPARSRRKRLLDIVLGGALLVVSLPVLAALGLFVRLVDGGPVLFRQRRIGRHGRPFRMLKLRTMSLDAEERLVDLRHHNEVRGSAFKLASDPRLTRTGRFLRRTSLDELPQLWNVVRGDMSLVGPRPPLPEEVDAYEPWHHRRLAVRPGMTGRWQVEGRHLSDFDEWVRLDLAWMATWSLRGDLVLLVRTLPAMVRGRGR